jgi:hypothetical protein
MSLPASARRRWGLAGGGTLGYLDVGDAIVLVPGGVASLRREQLETLTEEDLREARLGFGDRELATE